MPSYTLISMAVVETLLACALAAQSPQAELPVSANMDIYRAGGFDDGSDGVAPAIYNFTPKAGRTLHFSSVSGSWTCAVEIGPFTADGLAGSTCFGKNIGSATLPFSGYNLTDFAGALAGVFLTDTLPAVPPSALRFYDLDSSQGGIQTSFNVLAPAIGQIFFIGDGLTGTGIGKMQTFRVPDNATHLYLGFVDACTLTSTTPGCYSDNAGSLTAILHFEEHSLNWVEPQLTAAVPSTRCCPGMAYDLNTKSTLLFGGGNGGIYPPIRYNDTWIYRDEWRRLSPANAPSPRQGASLAYDRGTGTVMLFGGGNGVDPSFGDTWTWNGVNWTQHFPMVSPPGLESDSPQMVYDALIGAIVLWDGGARETWVWNGAAGTWTQQFPANSPPASDASIAYDEKLGKIVLFGGNATNGAYLDQTWTWDGANWTEEFPPVSPSARSLPQMTYDPILGKVVLFAGTAGPPSALDDTWTWDGRTWAPLTPANSPVGRWAGGMVFDPPHDGLLLFGGELVGDPFANDTWFFTSAPTH